MRRSLPASRRRILIDLQHALSLLRRDELGSYTTGWLQEYDSLTWLNAARQGRIPADHAKSIDSNLVDLLFILDRIEWQRQLRIREVLPAKWMRYLDLDIDSFHVKLRSAFDHLAAVIAKNSFRPGEVKHESFHQMRNWVKKPGNYTRMGRPLAVRVKSCGWFDSFIETRDSIVHGEELTLAYPDSDRVAFQVYEGSRNIVEPFIKVGPNIIDFELYAALYLGRSLTFFDRVFETIFRIQRFEVTGTSPKRYSEGVAVLDGWIGRLISVIEEMGN